MVFFEKVKRLATEFFHFRKYRMMHPVLAVFAGIFVIPFVLSFLSMLFSLFILSVILSFFSAPIEFIHRIVKTEGKEMKTPTQVVIYIISWPLLFLFYVLLALGSLLFYVFYFFAAMVGYIASLGGYRFHISPMVEDIALPEMKKRYNIPAAIFIGVAATIFIALGIAAIVVYNELYYDYMEALFPYRFTPVLYAFLTIYYIFSIIYIPIAFHNVAAVEAKEPEPEPKEE